MHGQLLPLLREKGDSVHQEATREQVDQVVRWATAIQENLVDDSLENQRAVMEVLDVQVHITGYADQRPGVMAVPKFRTG